MFTERPTVVTINYEDAVLISKRLVEEKGEDFTYTPVDITASADLLATNNEACVYFVRDNGELQPSCMVGHIIDELAEDKQQLDYMFILNGYNGININVLCSSKVVAADEQTKEFLTVLQACQDAGDTWASSLEVALERAKESV